MRYLDTAGVPWESGERRQFAVPYQFNGVARTYFPDFHLLDSGTFVELKPARLVGTPENQAKFAAAAKAFEAFEVVTKEDVPFIDCDALRAVCQTGEVVLLDRWQRRLETQ